MVVPLPYRMDQMNAQFAMNGGQGLTFAMPMNCGQPVSHAPATNKFHMPSDALHEIHNNQGEIPPAAPVNDAPQIAAESEETCQVPEDADKPNDDLDAEFSIIAAGSPWDAELGESALA